MKFVTGDKNKRIIRGQEEITFSSFTSYHLIILRARAKGEKQISESSTDDEDLIIQIDDKKFPSPADISGGSLHDLSKTVYLLTFLQGKNHKLILNTDDPPGTATFEKLEIYTFDPTDTLTLEPKIQAENGDRRAWLAFVLDNIPLKDVSITVTYSRRKKDSDDIKVKIDGQTQENLFRNIKHFLWYFAGSLISLIESTKTESQSFTTSFSSGLHYIEIDADRMPILEEITFNFGSKLSLPKRIPTDDNPKWTGDFYDDTELMLLARAVYGEVGGESKEAKIAVAWTIRTRVEDEKNRWGKTYHDVILADFQYEPFNNPKGDPFKKITQPLLGDPLEKQAWQESYKVAEFVFFGKESDPTKGANHFYVPSDQPKQDWVDEKKFTVQIGATRFYKL